MASLTIHAKVVLLSIREVEIVSVVVGLRELIMAVKTGGQAGISERLVQQAKVVDATRRPENKYWR